jgi:hypothetical protein
MNLPYNAAPSHQSLAAGRAPKPTGDAIARLSVRADMPRGNAGDYRPDAVGGMPQARGPETNVPALLEAAARLHLNSSVIQRLLQHTQVPNMPGGMFNMNDALYRRFAHESGGQRPNDPVLQAMAGLRAAQAMHLF